MSKVVTCQELAHNILLKARKLERTVNSDLFARLVAEEEHIDKLYNWIRANDAESILDYMRSHDRRDIEDLNYTEVRAIAKKLIITNYCRKSQQQLIREIKSIQTDLSHLIQSSLTITSLLEKQ